MGMDGTDMELAMAGTADTVTYHTEDMDTEADMVVTVMEDMDGEVMECMVDMEATVDTGLLIDILDTPTMEDMEATVAMVVTVATTIEWDLTTIIIMEEDGALTMITMVDMDGDIIVAHLDTIVAFLLVTVELLKNTGDSSKLVLKPFLTFVNLKNFRNRSLLKSYRTFTTFNF